MDECGGVRIHFPPTGSKKDEIRLHGPKEDVKKAEAMLLEMAEELVRKRKSYQRSNIGGCYTEMACLYSGNCI